VSRLRQVTDPVCYHGEGPVWWSDGTLKWVDMFAGDVLSLDASGHLRRVHVSETVAVIRPRTNGGVIVATTDAFILAASATDFFADGASSVHTQVHPPKPLLRELRFNEGECDPAGNFYCGTAPRTGNSPTGHLYRVNVDGTVVSVLSDISVSNGLVWAAARAFYVDSSTGFIDTMRWDPATGLTHRTPWADVSQWGIPDGLAIDREDNIWVAVYGGGCVLRLDGRGKLVDRIDLPVSRVTACTFGGPGLSELYITTSRENARDPEPQAGAVFALRTDTAGHPVRPFCG
jgi:sugar lactone lactonase YvrE